MCFRRARNQPVAAKRAGIGANGRSVRVIRRFVPVERLFVPADGLGDERGELTGCGQSPADSGQCSQARSRPGATKPRAEIAEIAESATDGVQLAVRVQLRRSSRGSQRALRDLVVTDDGRRELANGLVKSSCPSLIVLVQSASSSRRRRPSRSADSSVSVRKAQ